MACWHSEFSCFQFYSLSLESGPVPCVIVVVTTDSDVSLSSSSALIMILSMTLSISCSLLMNSSSTDLTCPQTAAHPYIITAAKFFSTSCWIILKLKVTSLQLFWSSRYPKFFLWGLNQVGRDVVWSLCVRAGWANNQLKKAHIAVYAFFWDRTSLYFCHVGAVLVQPEQPFNFSGIAGWVAGDLYVVVRRTVDQNKWYGLRIRNELLLQPFHVVVAVSTFWTISKYWKNIGYETSLSAWKRSNLFEIKKRLFEQWNVCV